MSLSIPRENSSPAAVAGARELLVVTYHFPPIQSAGVYRILGLVKYLHARSKGAAGMSMKDAHKQALVGAMVVRKGDLDG